MINIIPKPCKIAIGDGTINLTNSTIVTTEFVNAKSVLNQFLATMPSGIGVSVNMVKNDNMQNEHYKLEIASNSVTIFAANDNSAILAAQSLIQLCGTLGSVECCVIEDSPRYKWRGFMLDSARHFWTVKDVKDILDIMSNLKLNTFHWHLTDDQGWRVEIKKRPLLTTKGTARSSTQIKPLSKMNDDKEYGAGLFYSQEDIKSVVKYASNLGINIVPEIDMPGHLVAAISCYPEISCEGADTAVSNRWGVLDNIGCCGNEALYDFIRDVLDEVCAMFPYEYFHIGGDEVPKTKWKKCPKCQAKMKELGLANEEELQGYFNNFVAQYIKPLGKKIIGWNEILNATTIDTDALIQWWTPNSGRAKIEKFISDGGKVIMSKHQNFYMDHSYAVRPLSRTYKFNPSMLGVKSDDSVMGIEAPQWTEYISSREKFDFNTFPRMMALAENAWTDESLINYQDFETRLEYGRNFFENYYNIKMANPFFYRGGSVRGNFFKNSRAWLSWSNNPNLEFQLSKNNK